MNKEFYEELEDLVDIHDKCSADGAEIICFKLIKKIVDGKILKKDIDEKQRILAKKQLVESLEWFQSIGITVKFQEELLKVID